MDDALPRPKTTDPLDALRNIALDLGSSETAADAAELASRVADGLFNVACVGQFKRGKSTLINALVGQSVLPTGVVPVTAVITIVRHGPALRTIVRFEDGHNEDVGHEKIADYVTEERNPGNGKGVRAVEVVTPGDFLSTGMCLVDTPGLGSVFEKNSEATRAFVPHIDAALVVVGGDPPISGEEAALARTIGLQTPHMIVVLNKADRLPDHEVDTAAAFTRRTLSTVLGHEPDLVVVSAAERAGGRSTRDWSRLEETLRTLAEESGASLIRASLERGVLRLKQRLLHEIGMRRRALTTPIESFERSVELLRSAVADARLALRDLSHLFASDHGALLSEFEEERSRFLEKAIPEVTQKVEAETDGWRDSRDGIIRACQSGAEQAVREWRAASEGDAEDAYARTIERYDRLILEFARRVADSGIDSEAASDAAPVAERRFSVPSRYYFHELWRHTQRLPIEWLVDLLLTGGIRHRRAAREGRRFLKMLLEINSTRVVNDLEERVRESRRRVGREIASRIEQIAGAAERALEEARRAHAEGAEGVAAEIARLDRMKHRVETIAIAP